MTDKPRYPSGAERRRSSAGRVERVRSIHDLDPEVAETLREKRRQALAQAGAQSHYSANRPVTLPLAEWLKAADAILKPEVKT